MRPASRSVTLWEGASRPVRKSLRSSHNYERTVRVCMAVGGSSNTIIHIPAIATEAELPMECSRVYTEASSEIRAPCRRPPESRQRTPMEEFAEAGGLGAILGPLRKRLYTDVMTADRQDPGTEDG